jgi:diguanylate cyclase (GGDEF)-like protein
MKGESSSMLAADNKSVMFQDFVAASEASRQRGDYLEGVEWARRAIDHAKVNGEPGQQAEALRLLANQLLRTGDMEEAAEACGEAASLEETTGNETGRAQALTLQAMAYLNLGLQEEALQVLAISLEIAQRLRDPNLLFWAYNRIGGAHDNMGNHLESRAFMQRALPLATGLGAEAKFCILNNLAANGVDLAADAIEKGDTALVADAVAAGLNHARDAIELARAADHPYREAIGLGNYGMLLAFGGDEQAASQATTRSHAIASQKGYASLQLDAGFNLARIAMHFDQPETAITRFEGVLPALIEHDEKPMVLRAHRLLSDLYQRTGRTPEAFEHYKRFHAIESAMRSSVADTRARMVTGMAELSAALLDAERAKLETRLHQMRLAELETERRDLLTRTQDLDRQAHEDDLTGLKNRRYALSALGERLADCPQNAAIPVAIVDADHFKKVNDSFGHSTGDAVLRRLAELLSSGMEGHGFVARLGGEEFLLVFDARDIVTAMTDCQRIRTVVAAESWTNLAPDLAMTVSIGITSAGRDEDVAKVLARADAALYRSKSGGRNRVTANLLD